MSPLLPHFENKRHVIWDWNGTLLNDLDHALASVNRVLTEEGLRPTTMELYKKEFRFPVIEYYRHLGFDVSPDNFRRLCDRFNDHFYGGLASCDLWPGARELLARVKREGKTQSVLSASEHGMLVESVRRYGIEAHFDHVFGIADKLAASKVQRGHELMTRAGVPARDTILVGDSDHDFEVGQALGVDVVLVEHGHMCETRLRAVHPTVVRVF